MLVKPKCVWEAVVFFNIWKFIYIFQMFVYNFLKDLLPLKRILALSIFGSNMHLFWATAFYFCYFSNRTPCSEEKWNCFPFFSKLCKQFRTGMNGSRQHLISLKKVNEPFNCRFFSVKSITVHCSWLIFNFSNKTPFMYLTKIA